MATGLGADVTILEVDLERMRFLDITMHTAHTLYSSEASLTELLPNVDLLIGAVLVPGARAPKLISREMLRSMKPGSVLVDIAIDQGGCAETSRPTTHDHPTFIEEGVIHYCVANMPGAYARTATQALANVTYPLHRGACRFWARRGHSDANRRLVSGINIHDGPSDVQSRGGGARSGVFSSSLTMTLEQQIHGIGAKARVRGALAGRPGRPSAEMPSFGRWPTSCLRGLRSCSKPTKRIFPARREHGLNTAAIDRLRLTENADRRAWPSDIRQVADLAGSGRTDRSASGRGRTACESRKCELPSA